ncbi:MAG: hypothetical protein IKD23_03415 [Lentisphaeria bacterium]|nr:hypothetical protein [Lentisphaeria bacterium]
MSLCLWILPVFAVELTPLTGGVCLRYDDNQMPETWRAMLKVFNSRGAAFSAALNMQEFPEAYFPVVRELAGAGCEILDHAPNHRMFKLRPASLSDFEQWSKHPGVAYADPESRWLYLRYDLDLTHPANLKGQGTIRDDKLTAVTPEGIFGKIPENFPRMIYIPEVKKLVAIRSTADKNIYQVCSFYGSESAGLPELKNCSFIWLRGNGRIRVHPESMQLLIEAVRKRCKDIGIPAPAVWVQPAGWEPLMQSPAMIGVYGKAGYAVADCLEGKKAWYFNDPDFHISRFSTSSRALSLDIAELPAVKTLIADGVARHHVLTIIAHIRTRNMEKYLADTGTLLDWLAEYRIPLAGMKKWCDFIASSQTPSGSQIMPDLSCDRDGNGRPDGFFASGGAELKVSPEGAVLTRQRGPGALEIPELCGMEKGKNVFHIVLRGHPGSPVRFTFVQRTSSGKVTASAVKGGLIGKDGILDMQIPLEIVAKTALLDTTVSFISLKTPAVIKQITLKKAK